MTRTSLASLIALTVGIGGALASSIGLEEDGAYATQAFVLDRADLHTHAATIFERADENENDVLDVNEYAALATVTAELSLLNGFVTLETGSEPQKIILDEEAASAMTRSERARLEAVSRNEFYQAAGEDAGLNLQEFAAIKSTNFNAADRNDDGELTSAELAAFAASESKAQFFGV